jgi:hypothetical protein
MKHSKPFTILPNQVLKDKRLSHADKIIYWAISTFAYGTKDIAYPGNEALFELTGILSQHISKHTTNLRDCGYIEIIFDKRTARGYPKIKYRILPVDPQKSQTSAGLATHTVSEQTDDHEQPSPNLLQPTTNSPCLTTNSPADGGSRDSIAIIGQSQKCDSEEIQEGETYQTNTKAFHGGVGNNGKALSDAKSASDDSSSRVSISGFHEAEKRSTAGISSGAGTAQGDSHQAGEIRVTSTPTVGQLTSQYPNANTRDVSPSYSRSEFNRMLTNGDKVIQCGDTDGPISILWFLLEGFKLFLPEADLSDAQNVFAQMMRVGEQLIAAMFQRREKCTLNDLVNEYGQLLKGAFNGSLPLWSAGKAPSIALFSDHIEDIIRGKNGDWREAKTKGYWSQIPFQEGY